MEVGETEVEILRISKPVSLPFEGLDFVNETLCGLPSQSVEIEVVEGSSPVGPEGFAHSCVRHDVGAVEDSMHVGHSLTQVPGILSSRPLPWNKKKPELLMLRRTCVFNVFHKALIKAFLRSWRLVL